MIGKSGQCLIDAIIDNLLCQMIWARGVGVHAGAFTYRVESGQNLDRGGIISGVFTHSWQYFRLTHMKGFDPASIEVFDFYSKIKHNSHKAFVKDLQTAKISAA